MTTLIEKKLAEIGVTINGNQPWDIQVHNKNFINRVLRDQSMGAGESYMEGWWDCEKLDELFYRICRNRMGTQFYAPWKMAAIKIKNALINQQTPEKSVQVAERHYNLGNDLFERMLGKSMAYTCGYWKEAKTLDEAQFAKYELVCKKMYLKPGEKVLDIGCGWGGLTKYMAERYLCEVVAMDIGKEPAEYAKLHCKNLPVQVYQCDYRDTSVYNPNNVKFDKIVSVGVLEHVGYKNYEHLLKLARGMLKENGIFLLHSIGGNKSKNYCDPWINHYIFPNGMLPSIKQLSQPIEDTFVVEDFQNFGAYYDKTLQAWNNNLNDHWYEVKSKYSEPFHRMMNYYLLSCAGSFRARDMQLWQFVLTPKGLLNGYVSVR